MIYFHAMLHHLMIMNEYADQFPPLEKGYEGFVFCSVIGRSVLCDVRISSTRSVIAKSAATWQSHPPAPSLRGAQRRGNLI
jgi:hypothetical protein